MHQKLMTCDVIQNAVFTRRYAFNKVTQTRKAVQGEIFLKEFPNRNWTLGGLNHLLRKIDNFVSVDQTVAG